MIVESMTYMEICREYNHIHDNYFPRVKSKMKHSEFSKIRKYMLKHKSLQNVLFAPMKYKVDNNTLFCAIPIVQDYKTLTKIGPTVVTFIIYHNKNGLNAIVRGGDYDNHFTFITSHFFERYIERFIGTKISKIAAIGEFVANNDSFILTRYPTKK